MLEYDAHYLKELTEEKEALTKTGKDNSHALRLLESGKFLLYVSKGRFKKNGMEILFATNFFAFLDFSGHFRPLKAKKKH